jgi:hypothetical protein
LVARWLGASLLIAQREDIHAAPADTALAPGAILRPLALVPLPVVGPSRLEASGAPLLVLDLATAGDRVVGLSVLRETYHREGNECSEEAATDGTA